MAKRRLPTGIQTFRKVREENCYYVDKTAFIERLIAEGTHYFLSRPRRFGKSLFLDTLKELFEGNEALFKGLHVHAGWTWGEPHPVVRLSFGGGSFKDPEVLTEDVALQLGSWKRRRASSPAQHAARRVCAVCCGNCTGGPGSGWRCWWTSTTSRSWTRLNCRR